MMDEVLQHFPFRKKEFTVGGFNGHATMKYFFYEIILKESELCMRQ